MSLDYGDQPLDSFDMLVSPDAEPTHGSRIAPEHLLARGIEMGIEPVENPVRTGTLGGRQLFVVPEIAHSV